MNSKAQALLGIVTIKNYTFHKTLLIMEVFSNYKYVLFIYLRLFYKIKKENTKKTETENKQKKKINKTTHHIYTQHNL